MRSDQVVLIGMMGTGKTTIGRIIADRWGWQLCDSDREIEARTGRTVREIFEEDGEPAFRTLESAVVADALADSQPSVIAAAGGVVLDPRNRERLREGGIVIWLDAPADVLADRILKAGQGHRPLLANDPLGTLRRLAAERQALYAEVADEVVDVGGLTSDLAAEAVLDRLHAHGMPS